jgi:hypothetical protein
VNRLRNQDKDEASPKPYKIEFGTVPTVATTETMGDTIKINNTSYDNKQH